MNVKHSVCRKWGKGGWNKLIGIAMVLQSGVAASWRGQMKRAVQISRLCHHLFKLHLFANSNPSLCPHLPIPLSPRSKNDKSTEIHLQLNQHTIIRVMIEKENEREKISISMLQSQSCFHMHRDNVCLIGYVKWPIYHVSNTSPPVHA